MLGFYNAYPSSSCIVIIFSCQSFFSVACASDNSLLSSSSAFLMSTQAYVSSSTRFSNYSHYSVNVLVFSSISALCYSFANACLIPYAIELSYNLWYALNWFLNSSLTLTRRNPRSAQFMVIYRITSSKHYWNNGSLIGHMPQSLA